MIKSKQDYLRYLKEDRKALGAYTRFPCLSDNTMILLTDPCYRFQKLLRKLEYWTNCRNFWWTMPYLIYLRKKFQRLSVALGISIPVNVFAEGLCISHYGSIVVSRHARIGRYCVIHSGVNIGGDANRRAATIGDHCFIGPGAKIIKPVVLGNQVSIGANAVVNKDFNEDGITLAGVPARIVKYDAVPQGASDKD